MVPWIWPRVVCLLQYILYTHHTHTHTHRALTCIFLLIALDCQLVWCCLSLSWICWAMAPTLGATLMGLVTCLLDRPAPHHSPAPASALARAKFSDVAPFLTKVLLGLFTCLTGELLIALACFTGDRLMGDFFFMGDCLRVGSFFGDWVKCFLGDWILEFAAVQDCRVGRFMGEALVTCVLMGLPFWAAAAVVLGHSWCRYGLFYGIVTVVFFREIRPGAHCNKQTAREWGFSLLYGAMFACLYSDNGSMSGGGWSCRWRGTTTSMHYLTRGSTDSGTCGSDFWETTSRRATAIWNGFKLGLTFPTRLPFERTLLSLESSAFGRRGLCGGGDCSLGSHIFGGHDRGSCAFGRHRASLCSWLGSCGRLPLSRCWLFLQTRHENPIELVCIYLLWNLQMMVNMSKQTHTKREILIHQFVWSDCLIYLVVSLCSSYLPPPKNNYKY